MELELGLDPDDASRLTRLALLAPLRNGKARSRVARIIWHDSPDRALAQQGLALAEQRPLWRLERLVPGAQTWPPGSPAPVVATGRTASALGHILPEPLIPVAAFEGRAGSLSLATEHGPVDMTLLNGAVLAVAAEHRLSRVRLEGTPAAVQPLAVALAARFASPCRPAAWPPRRSRSPRGRRRNRGTRARPICRPACRSPRHSLMSSYLSDVVVHFAPTAASGREGPGPVHQMRVAVRRLRSAIKVFRPAVSSPAVDAADAGLKALAAKLAPTRDWEFLRRDRPLGRRCVYHRAPPAAAACRSGAPAARVSQRTSAPSWPASQFRRLGIELAGRCAGLAYDRRLSGQQNLVVALDDFAARVLDKRLKRLTQIDDDLSAWSPPRCTR